MKKIKHYTINASILIASLLLSLTLIEVYLRYFPFPKDSIIPEICKSYAPIQIEQYRFSMSNYSYPANADMPHCAEEFHLTNKTDVNGYLGSSIANNKHHVLVFGDSFAYGLGVNKNEAFASLIGAYNGGMYGTTFHTHAQTLNKLLQQGRSYKIAFWVIYPPHIISASHGNWSSRNKIDKSDHPILFKVINKYNDTALSKAILVPCNI